MAWVWAGRMRPFGYLDSTEKPNQAIEFPHILEHSPFVSQFTPSHLDTRRGRVGDRLDRLDREERGLSWA